LEKDLRYVELFELYQGLLTEKQREMFLSHYCYDLSLAEIAEPEGSTRQSVYAVIKTVKEKLDEYEQKLGFLDKNQKLVEIAKQMDKANKEIADKILEIIGK
jgi:predicted DNA-binding protein YlxM (UPF0122 family)